MASRGFYPSAMMQRERGFRKEPLENVLRHRFVTFWEIRG